MARAEDRAVPTTESVARATSLNGGAPTPVIQVRELGKSSGPVEAVRGVDITVGAGEIVAFLGPNGAGKTTTMEILAGHRQRDAGEVSVLGFDPGTAPRAFRERIGIVPRRVEGLSVTQPLVGARVAVRRFRWDPVAPGSRGRQREPDVSPATG